MSRRQRIETWASGAIALALVSVQSWRLWPLLGGTQWGNGDRAQMATEAWFLWIPRLVITPSRDLFHPPIIYLLAKLSLLFRVSDAALHFPAWALAVLAPAAAVVLLRRPAGLAAAVAVALWLATHPLLDLAAQSFSSLSITVVAGLWGWTHFAPGRPTLARFGWRELALFWILFNATVLSWWMALTLLVWTLLVQRLRLGRAQPLAAPLSRPLVLAAAAVLVRTLLGISKFTGGLEDAVAVQAGSPFGWWRPGGMAIFDLLAARPVDVVICAAALFAVLWFALQERRRGLFWVLAVPVMALALLAYSYGHRVKTYYAVLLLPGIAVCASLGLRQIGRRCGRRAPAWCAPLLAGSLVLAALAYLAHTPPSVGRTHLAVPSLDRLGYRPQRPFTLVTCEAEGILPYAWLLAKRTGQIGYLTGCRKQHQDGYLRLLCTHAHARLWGGIYVRDSLRDWQRDIVERLRSTAPAEAALICPEARGEGAVQAYAAKTCRPVEKGLWPAWRCHVPLD